MSRALIWDLWVVNYTFKVFKMENVHFLSKNTKH